MPLGGHPFPNLVVHPESGLTIPWAHYNPSIKSTDEWHLGPDGVTCVLPVLFYWSDVVEALKQTLGYSYRDTTFSQPDGFEVSGIITGATFATPIVVSSANHGLSDGQLVQVYDVMGNLSANGTFFVRTTGLADPVNTFALYTDKVLATGAVGNDVYTSGGEWKLGLSRLRRVLPWQHPFFGVYYVKRIASAIGICMQSTSQFNKGADDNQIANRGDGAGGVNAGPWTTYTHLLMVLEFWRPPYYVRSDANIGVLAGNVIGQSPEWRRYVDKDWEIVNEALSREHTSFVYQDTVAAGVPVVVPGGVMTKTVHQRATRKWYEVPEAGLFRPADEQFPEGLARNVVCTQTTTTNPITGYVQPAGWPIGGCVNSPFGGGTNDAFQATRLFGCYMGTLLFLGCKFHQRPLQMPAWMMNIPQILRSPLSVRQYDVEFMFDIFDPPRGNTIGFRGHNLFPRTKDGLFYPVQSQLPVDGSVPLKVTTPFQYADLTDLFQIL